MFVRRAYAIKAIEGNEIGPEDQKDIRMNLIPQIDRLIMRLQEFARLAEQVQRDLQEQLAGGGGSDECGYCTMTETVIASSGDMLRNAHELKADAVGLAGGMKPGSLGEIPIRQSRPAPGGTCFIGAAEE